MLMKIGRDQHNLINNFVVYFFVYFFIFLLQSMIMNENVDRKRDKRSSMCRRLIRHTCKYPSRPKPTHAEEIAFAKDIILLDRAHPRDAARPKAKCEVRQEDEPMTRLDTGASTSNSAKIRVMNHKNYKAWKVRIRSSIRTWQSSQGKILVLLYAVLKLGGKVCNLFHF